MGAQLHRGRPQPLEEREVAEAAEEKEEREKEKEEKEREARPEEAAVPADGALHSDH